MNIDMKICALFAEAIPMSFFVYADEYLFQQSFMLAVGLTLVLDKMITAVAEGLRALSCLELAQVDGPLGHVILYE